MEDVCVPFQQGGLFGIKDVTNCLSKKHIGSLKASTGGGAKLLSFLGSFVSSLLSAIIVSKLLCLPKPRRSKGEAPGHRVCSVKGSVCDRGEGVILKWVAQFYEGQ